METTHGLDVVTVRRIAVEGLTSERTVAAYLAGRKVKPLSIARIRRAMERLGLGVTVVPDNGAQAGGAAVASDRD